MGNLTRYYALALLVAAAIGLLAWLGDSVGGAGFWTNVGWIASGCGWFLLVVFVVVLLAITVGALVSGQWSWWVPGG